MDPLCHHGFDTPIGPCTLVWGLHGVLGLRLPGADGRPAGPGRHAAAVDAPPNDAMRRVVARILGLLDGGRDDLADIVLDFRGITAFDRRVYVGARAIAPGRTTSYGELAAALGEPGAARAVGRALGANPFAILVPCHRVLAAGGRPGGFSAPGGVATKLRLLEIEGACIGDGPSLFAP